MNERRNGACGCALLPLPHLRFISPDNLKSSLNSKNLDCRYAPASFPARTQLAALICSSCDPSLCASCAIRCTFTCAIMFLDNCKSPLIGRFNYLHPRPLARQHHRKNNYFPASSFSLAAFFFFFLRRARVFNAHRCRH